MTQSGCEPLSRVKFPDHQGKYREFDDLRLILRLSRAEKSCVRGTFLAPFPKNHNREFCSWIRERIFPDPLSIRDLICDKCRP